ncbi:LRR receptor-like serine/threonine-protein kinase GSO1 [Lycium barbarum]|uniref:LRR receptor-like serine/threonine-protein kinase GSO1 n=1 Tax=Lycium barbarum TaxID=112863 RepID=UPI00293F467F|nr:LRR receptor-like serine/threonine-protein kinase GSO1 [Lycium barbarum]
MACLDFKNVFSSLFSLIASRCCSSTRVSKQSSRALSTIAPLESIRLTLPVERSFLLFRRGNHFTGGIPAMLDNCSQLETILLNDNSLSGFIPPEIFKSSKLLKLDLGHNQLNGTIPSEVGLSKNLQFLGLWDNYLSGNIPKELFDLPNLTDLELHTNYLTGPLPDFPSSCSISKLSIFENHFSGSLPITFRNCHNLTTFYASSANLGGFISPEVFRGLSNLESLYLDDNHFEGEIPETLWNGSLQKLVLSLNMFNGSISEKIGGCPRINYIDLSANKLTGQIPRSVGRLKNLNNLILYTNNLTGSLPAEFVNCTSLVEISLFGNSIGGEIPQELCNLQALIKFNVYQNLIQGPILECIGRMSGLEELGLSQNRLTGKIPPGITNMTKLTYLVLAHNNLTGEIPPNLGKNNFPGLVKVDLGYNNFSGRIPSELCNGNTLGVLVLENNRFSGSFPTHLAKCKSLYRLKLPNNHLQGSIPDNIEKNENISYLDVQGNMLSGRIPAAFGYWTNLSMINLSKNMFSGSIPAELGKLQNLVRLSISSNRLTGKIPLQLSYSAKLAELDLSNNSLSGRIPKEIASSSVLKSLLLQDNKLSGAFPDTFSSTQKLKYLQLGNNLLEGPIPCSLSKLRQPNFELNLSMNKFTGEIPRYLGNLDTLEKLDISSNNLSGAIPSEMDKMRSLLFLNISFNNLSGKIPISWEKLLSSHQGSAQGNPRLCLSGMEGSSCKHVKNSHVTWKTLAGIISGCVLSMAIIAAAIYLLVTWTRHPFLLNKHRPVKCLSGIEDLPDRINFEDIVHATEGWSEKYVIGRGKHGTVYKMESAKSTKAWAVKKVDLAQTAFNDEMRTLNSVRHRNLVRLGGYCIRHGYGFILTEFIPGGTLHDVLHQSKPPVVLDWESRHRIALGVAQSLSYLHHDSVPQIIHRDLKSDNVMLDAEMVPKIGNFGIAKIVSDSDENSTNSKIVGTLGYIAPENAYSVRLTEKSDVYSYGVLLLELFCRKMPVDPSFEEGLDIVFWVRKNLQRSNNFLCFLDEEISLWEVEEQRKALKIVDLALQCAQLEASTRPAMRDVVRSLLELNHRCKVKK